jgi:hypothetical protein
MHFSVIEMHEKRAIGGQTRECGFDTTHQKRDVVVELVLVGRAVNPFHVVAPSAEAAARAVRGGAHPYPLSGLLVPGVERGIDVDQTRKLARKLRQNLRIVTVHDALHPAEPIIRR